MVEQLSAFFLRGIFSFATLFIAVFILFYSIVFLHKTKHSKERRTWEILASSSFIFLAFEVLSLFSYFNLIFMSRESMFFITRLFEFLYAGLVLFAFITQHYLISNSRQIIISRKKRR